MLFSERNKLAEEYKVWLEENPQVEDCPLNVVTFLDSRMLLINSKEKEEISSKTEMKWSWNETNSDTWNHGTFKTKEEAFKDAIGCKDWIKRELGTDNPIIFIGQCEDIPLRTDPDPDRIMEELDQAYCDDSGCDTYIYVGVTDEERKWLEDKLSELMFEFHQKIGLNPGWFKVVTMEEIDLNDSFKRKDDKNEQGSIYQYR